MRVTETDVFGSQKLGTLRLQDNLRRTPYTFSRILECTSSTDKAVNSRSECMMSSHVSGVELTKPNSEQNPMYKVGVNVLTTFLIIQWVISFFKDNNNDF